MGVKDSVKQFYLSLSAYEDSVLGSLEDPSENPSMATDILLGLTTEEVETDLLYRLSHNPTALESSLQEVVDLQYAVTREVQIRAMQRRDYYADAGGEHYDEKLRLERKKLITLQSVQGNTEIQRG